MTSLQDKLNKLAEDGPIAGLKRAAAIAAMNELTIDEFRELTGIGITTYGIYHIAESGISVADSVKMENLTARQQDEFSRSRKLLSLSFPCSPEDFLQWYEATCGEFYPSEDSAGKRAPSDFPLATGFIDEVRRLHMPNELDLSRVVTSKRIIEAFLVKEEIAVNKKWWDKRLRDPVNYGLLECRALPGKPGRGSHPSLWYPMLVAAWLLDKNHMVNNAIAMALESHFPNEDSEYFRN